MGTLNRAELRDEVVANLGGRIEFDTADTSEKDTLDRALERAQERIVRRNRTTWAELRRYSPDGFVVSGTVAVDAIYPNTDYPASLHKWRGIFRQESTEEAVKLIGLSRGQWGSLIGQNSTLATGRVTHYTEEADVNGLRQLLWFRVPRVNIALYRYYSVFPAALTDLTASELENKDDLLIAFATSHCFKSLQQFDEANQWMGDFNSELGQALMDNLVEPDIQQIHRNYSADGIRGPNPWQDPFYKGR